MSDRQITEEEANRQIRQTERKPYRHFLQKDKQTSEPAALQPGQSWHQQKPE